jgi:hypothetical protein
MSSAVLLMILVDRRRLRLLAAPVHGEPQDGERGGDDAGVVARRNRDDAQGDVRELRHFGQVVKLACHDRAAPYRAA